MRYEPSYRRQVFSENGGFPDTMALLQAISGNNYGSRMPKDKRGKMVSIELPIGLVIVLIAAGIIYMKTHSITLTLVLGMVALFYVMGLMAFVGLILSRTVFSTDYTETVTAKCIGISIRGMSDHFRLIKTPVFKYYYGGSNHIAFDAMWSTMHDSFPEVGQDWQIEINPDDPDDLRWQKGKKTGLFLIIWGIASILFATLLLWLTTQDEAFMETCLNEGKALQIINCMADFHIVK